MSRSKSQQKRKSTAWLSHPEEHRNTQARSGELDSMMTFMLSVLSQREKESRLPQLTPEKAADLYEDFLKGNLADVQLCWQQMEDYDPTLSTCLNARQSALAEMSWRIEPGHDMLADNAGMDNLARQQTSLLTSRLRAVDNLEDALVHLGMADFRGVAALEITGNNSRQKWCVIEPWNLVRPLRRGPWFFNKNADPVCPYPEILLEDRVIIREARPLDLAAMFLVMSKTHALQGWDGFLDIYGLPSIFAELPPSIPEERRAEFDAVVRRIVGDGRGTVPAGTKFQTVETTKDNAQAFEQRAKWCDDAIIKLVLGGLLTVQAESGSGTLAGNAHADSFDRLCAASARSISRAVDTQFCRPILKAAFPDQPILVHFVFGDEEQEDHAQNAQLLAVAKQAGWQPDAETASQLLGWNAQPAPEAPPAAAPAPFVANRAAGALAQNPNSKSEDEPLSAEELEAINALAKGGLNQEQIAHDAATAADALAQAVQPASNAVANTDNDGNQGDDECHAKDPAHCPFHHPELKDDKDGDKPKSGQTEKKEDENGTVKKAAAAVRGTAVGKEISAVWKEYDERQPGEQHSAVHHLLHEASPKLVEEIKRQSGRDLAGYRHSISAMSIAHSAKHNLSEDEYLLIPDITDNYDTATYGKDKRGPKITYTKTYGDEQYLLVERIGNNGRGMLYFTTEYLVGKKKERGTGNSPEVGSP